MLYVTPYRRTMTWLKRSVPQPKPYFSALDSISKGKVKSLCLTKYHAMNTRVYSEVSGLADGSEN